MTYRLYKITQCTFGPGGLAIPTGAEPDTWLGRSRKEAVHNFMKGHKELNGSSVAQDYTVIYGVDNFYYSVEIMPEIKQPDA
jgi:hypothetical protein